jgi:hypothetical protein
MKITLDPDSPENIIVLFNERNIFSVKVTDCTNFSHDEEIKHKNELHYFLSVDVYDNYFLLSIEDLMLEEKYHEDTKLARICRVALIKAGLFWHDHVTSNLN